MSQKLHCSWNCLHFWRYPFWRMRNCCCQQETMILSPSFMAPKHQTWVLHSTWKGFSSTLIAALLVLWLHRYTWKGSFRKRVATSLPSMLIASSSLALWLLPSFLMISEYLAKITCKYYALCMWHCIEVKHDLKIRSCRTKIMSPCDFYWADVRFIECNVQHH